MNMVAWFSLCILAVIGLVGGIGRLRRDSHPSPEGCPGWLVVPLSADIEELEAQIRCLLHLRGWGKLPGPVILYPDRELEGEALDICRRLLDSAAGIVLSSPGGLEQTLAGLGDIHG